MQCTFYFNSLKAITKSLKLQLPIFKLFLCKKDLLKSHLNDLQGLIYDFVLNGETKKSAVKKNKKKKQGGRNKIISSILLQTVQIQICNP